MMLKTTIVYTGQQGLFFRDGVFVEVREPGRYRHRRRRERITLVDVRPKSIFATGREVLTADSATVRVAMVGEVKVSDAYQAYLANVLDQSYPSEPHELRAYDLTPLLEAKLREWAQAHTLAEALTKRPELDAVLRAEGDRVAALIGATVVSLAVTEFAPTGSIKTALANLLKADLEGQLALAKARHEAATLRSLMNTSRLIKDNPGLLELRLLASGTVPRLTFQVGGVAGSARPAEDA